MKEWKGRCAAFGLLFGLFAFGTASQAQTLDTGYVASVPNPSQVQGLALQADGKAVITTRTTGRRLTTTGADDSGFAQVGCVWDGFNSLTGVNAQADGNLIFTAVGCASFTNGIARFSPAGAQDQNFLPALVQGPGTYGGALVQPDGKILVYGNVSDGGAPEPQRSVLRLLAGGELDPSFTGLPYYITNATSLALQPDGRILAMYSPTSFTNFVFRLPAEGGDPETEFDNGSDFDPLGSVVLQPDGKVLAYGYNTNDWSETVVRFNSDGTRDAGFQPPALGGTDYWEHQALVLLADGKILVGNGFTSVNGVTRRGLARLNPDGSLDTGFDVGLAPTSGATVRAIAVQSDGGILIAGNFNSVGSTARAGVARLIPAEPVTRAVIVGPDNASIRWQRSGPAPEFERTSFEFSEDGATWSPLGAGVYDDGDWALTGLTLPRGQTFHIRARGWAASGHGSRSRSLHEQVAELLIEAETWTVTPSASEGGGIYPDESQSVSHGNTLDFALTPEPGFVIQNVEGTCGGELKGNVFTIAPVTADCTVVAQFEADTTVYTVSPSVVAGEGNIAPDTEQQTAPGSRVDFQLTPATGWHVAGVGGSCGGTLNGNIYTTAPVVADCTVQAGFAINLYTVDTGVSGGLGSIAPTSQQVEHGTPVSFDLTPAPGFGIGQVGGCGGTLSGTQYITAPITDDCTVTAEFVLTGTGQGELELTLAPYSGVIGTIDCTGTTDSLVINSGDYVALCIKLINNTDQTLDWMYRYDSKSGYFDSYVRYFPLAPGESIGPQPGSDIDTITFTPRVYRFFSSTTVEATWTGLASAPPTYSHDDTVPFEWIELSDSPTATALDLSGGARLATAEAQMPFSFNFFGRPDDKLCISQDGGILVGRKLGQSARDCELAITPYENYPPTLAGAHFRELLIAPAWAPSGYHGGQVLVDTQGTAPNRRYVVQWDKVWASNSSTASQPVTFQVVIDETSSEITFHYLSMNAGDPTYVDHGRNALAGLHRELPLGGAETPPDPATLPYSQYLPRLTDGKAVRWTPTPQPFTTTAIATAQVIVAAPDITVTPDPILSTAAPGELASVAVTIGNEQGNGDLRWSLDTLGEGTGFRIAEQYVPPEAPAGAATAKAVGLFGGGTSPALRQAAIGGGQMPQAAPEAGSFDRGAAQVPAYGLAQLDGPGGNQSRLIGLDAVSPQTTAAVVGGAGHFNSAETATFTDNDFSRLYSVVNRGANDDVSWTWGAGVLLNLGSSYGQIASGPLVRPRAPDDPTTLYWMGLAWDHTGNTLYGVASNAGAGDNHLFAACGQEPLCRSDLFTIDPSTGLSTWIARLDDVSPDGWGTIAADIAISPSGQLYAIEMTTDSLIAIDKATGHVQLIGSTGLEVYWWPTQSIDFDQSSGTLYYATWPIDSSFPQMYAVDPQSGKTRFLGLVGQGGQFYSLRGLSIAKRGGPCASPEEVPWLSWDLDEGTTPPGERSEVNLVFDAQGLDLGVHEAKLCVNSNTPLRSTVTVPVTFSVQQTPIFSDGFEQTDAP